MHRALHYVSQQTGTTKDIWFAPCPRRCLLPLEKRLRLATLARRVSALENCLLLVQEMAYRGHLRAVERDIARAAARTLGKKRSTQRGDSSGLPVCEDNRCRRRTTWLGWRQEGAWQEASSPCRHGRPGVLKAKVHSAKVPDQDGLRLVLKAACERLPRLSHLWVDAGYQGRGKQWAQQALSLTVQVVDRTPRRIPEKRLR